MRGENILVQENQLKDVYLKLVDSKNNLTSISVDLPGRSSSSTAMDTFESNFKDTQSIIETYSTLFTNDIENYKTAYETLIESEKDIARRNFINKPPTSSIKGRSGSGSGGGGGFR